MSRRRARPLDPEEERCISSAQPLQVQWLADERDYCFSWPGAPMTKLLRRSMSLGASEALPPPQGPENLLRCSSGVGNASDLYFIDASGILPGEVEGCCSGRNVKEQILRPCLDSEERRYLRGRARVVIPVGATWTADDLLFSLSTDQQRDLWAVGVLPTPEAVSEVVSRVTAWLGCRGADAPDGRSGEGTSVSTRTVANSISRAVLWRKYEVEQHIVAFECRALVEQQRHSVALQRLLHLRDAVPLEPRELSDGAAHEAPRGHGKEMDVDTSGEVSEERALADLVARLATGLTARPTAEDMDAIIDVINRYGCAREQDVVQSSSACSGSSWKERLHEIWIRWRFAATESQGFVNPIERSAVLAHKAALAHEQPWGKSLLTIAMPYHASGDYFLEPQGFHRSSRGQSNSLASTSGASHAGAMSRGNQGSLPGRENPFGLWHNLPGRSHRRRGVYSFLRWRLDLSAAWTRNSTKLLGAREVADVLNQCNHNLLLDVSMDEESAWSKHGSDQLRAEMANWKHWLSRVY